MEKITNCPICNNTSFLNVLNAKDYIKTEERFNIVQCSQCKLMITNPRPTEKECGPYYQSNEYVSHADKKITLMHTLYRIVRAFNLNNKYKLIQPALKSKNDLAIDYGCGIGTFLNFVKKKNHHVLGFDISEDARETVMDRYKIPVRKPEEIHDIKDNTVTVITTWHVLEHIYNLNEVVEQFYRVLKPGGTLVVALPNPQCYEAGIFQEYWDGFDVPRHIWHFPPSTVINWMQTKGFQHKTTKPLIYDSFYISLRSYFHQHDILAYPKALFMGLKSNIKGSKNANYSSNIYIFTK